MSGGQGVGELRVTESLFPKDAIKIQSLNSVGFRKLGISQFVKMQGGVNDDFLNKYYKNNSFGAQIPPVEFKVKKQGWVYIAVSQHITQPELQLLINAGWEPHEADWKKAVTWIRYVHPSMVGTAGLAIYKKWMGVGSIEKLKRITPGSPILLLP